MFQRSISPEPSLKFQQPSPLAAPAAANDATGGRFDCQTNESVLSHFYTGQLLQKGGNGAVYSARPIVGSGKEVVAKKFFGNYLTALSKAKHAAAVHKRCQDIEGVVSLMGAFACPTVGVWLVHEKLGIDLLDFLHEHMAAKVFVSEQAGKQVARQCFSTLKCMHAVQVLHADLKPDNIMLDVKPHSAQDMSWKAKLVDTDQCPFREVIESEGKVCGWSTPDPHFGTLSYMAPELVGHNSHAPLQCQLSDRIDVYSMGTVLICFLTGSPLMFCPVHKTLSKCIGDSSCNAFKHAVINSFLDGMGIQERARMLLSQKGLSNECLDAICAMVHPDPSKRPSASDCLKHPWLNDNVHPDPVAVSVPLNTPSPAA